MQNLSFTKLKDDYTTTRSEKIRRQKHEQIQNENGYNVLM